MDLLTPFEEYDAEIIDCFLGMRRPDGPCRWAPWRDSCVEDFFDEIRFSENFDGTIYRRLFKQVDVAVSAHYDDLGILI